MCNHFYGVNTMIVLTTYPPQYGCKCKYCGEIQYIFCKDLQNALKSGKYFEENQINWTNF